MKATGIVRRIDELGRIVIPKEIRRTMRIREGDPIEIYTEGSADIILKKYSPIGEMGDFTKQYAESLAIVSGCIVLICDRERIIAVSGGMRTELLGKHISKEIRGLMNDRRNLITGKDQKGIKIIDNKEHFINSREIDDIDKKHQIIFPIICEGDVIGAIIMLGKNEIKLSETEYKLASVAAVFIGKQMEN